MTARVRITAPVAGRSRRTTVVGEIDAQTEVGEVYMRSLMRSQLWLALRLTAVLVLTVGSLPLLFWLVPLHGWTAWIVLGVGCYPVLLLLGWRYVRRAERNEAVFRELVGPPRGNP